MKRREVVLSVLCLAACISGLGCAGGRAGPPGKGVATRGRESSTRDESAASARDRRMAWWREAKFGMFIHWGIYAVPAGEWKGRKGHGEWIMHTAQIPVKQYELFARQFNPVKFSAREWVGLAKKAGMKYIVITTKHHDGFCLFDSQFTGYDIMDAAPFKRDIMKELSDECRRQGIKIGWYYSVMDWHHPDYLPRRKWEKRPAEAADYNRYVDYMKKQLRELVTNYGPVGVIWFDGDWEHSSQVHRSKEVVAMLRSIQSDVIINERIGLRQDFDTPEQRIPRKWAAGRDWETCMTMNWHWGFCRSDSSWKSTTDLIRKLIDIASKGGNFLLNVGPTAGGVIPQPSADRLREIGEWMDVNGEAIYGTTASPFARLPWGRCTAKPGRLYLHIFSWPGKPLELPLLNKVKKAYLLSDPQRAGLRFRRRGRRLLIDLPRAAPDKIATVVALEIDGDPQAAIPSLAGGSAVLGAVDATIHGTIARYEGGPGKDNIGWWTNKADWVSWEVEVTKRGKYAVEVRYSCSADSAGSRYEVAVASQKLEDTVEPTGAWGSFAAKTIGTVTVNRTGRVAVSVRALEMPKGAVMNLKSVTLRRVK